MGTADKSKAASVSRRVVLTGLLGALLFLAQVVAAPLPNVELVSLLVILYALHFHRMGAAAVGVFIMLEGILYGFHLWWVSYLYIWFLLYLLARLFCKNTSPWFWAILSGAYGLAFGALCAIPYLFIGGPGAALSYFIAGIPFDIPHALGNFLLALLLFKPLSAAFSRVRSFSIGEK